MNAFVIDYGMGNLGSVSRALEECGATVSVGARPEDAREATHLVLPGVGSFADGMARLRAAGWPEALDDLVVRGGRPLLGICLGMQLLAGRGTEGGDTVGLGLIAGEVVRLVSSDPALRIPHVGWNELWPERQHPFLTGVVPGTDFYFVHSFHLKATDPASVLATTPYCERFASVVGRDHIVGTQFHPEKSNPVGFRLLRNFLMEC